MPKSENSPMSEAMYYVLLSLANPLHGYAVMDAVKKVSNGRINMGPGTLYGILKRLLKENLINLEEVDGTRKVYHINAVGHEALNKEFERLSTLVHDGKSYLGEGRSND
ncbi:PadR family transcriptional regulator [Ornithinibacillus salinisoli]|uniref:PadR family transcriptional regulator n=2 Tax=Ornithinibacillus salinisoli TaxID=1848459 RepID=A0ABW4VX12_9BACI